MKIEFKNLNIAIIGGDSTCKAILQILLGENFQKYNIKISGVVDSEKSKGVKFAKEKGIFTTAEYQDIFKLKGLNLIVKLTKNDGLTKLIEKSKPSNVKFLNYFESLFFFSLIQIDYQKLEAEKKLKKTDNIGEIEEVFNNYSASITEIINQKAKHFLTEEKELAESEKALSQIIQGSMIPTFVINQEHIVTHWNRALEKITGYTADNIVGTNLQWTPFR